MATPPHHPGSDNSDNDRYQRGVQAYASQFRITPEQVPAWFAGTVGDRFGQVVDGLLGDVGRHYLFRGAQA